MLVGEKLISDLRLGIVLGNWRVWKVSVSCTFNKLKLELQCDLWRQSHLG